MSFQGTPVSGPSRSPMLPKTPVDSQSRCPSRNVSTNAAGASDSSFNPSATQMPSTPVNSHKSLTPAPNSPRKTTPSGRMSSQACQSATESASPPPAQVTGQVASNGMQMESSGQQNMSPINQQQDVYDPRQMMWAVPNGMMYPTSTGIPGSQVTGLTNGKPMLYFNPQSCGYNEASGGRDPRHGYPLVYPYVPLIEQKDRLKKARAGCC